MPGGPASPGTQLPELPPPRLAHWPGHPAPDKPSDGETGYRPSSPSRKVPVVPASPPQEARGRRVKLYAPGPRFCTNEQLTSLWKQAWVGTAVASLPSKPDYVRSSHREAPVPHAECPGGVMMGRCVHPPPGRVPLGGVRTGHGVTRGVGAELGFPRREGRAESPTDYGDKVHTRPDASQILHFFLQQTRVKLRSEPMSSAGLSSALTASKPLPVKPQSPPRSPAHLASLPLGRSLCRLILPLTV